MPNMLEVRRDWFMFKTNGTRTPTFPAPVAIAGAGAAASAVAGVAAGADARTQGARRTGAAAESGAGRSPVAGSQSGRKILERRQRHGARVRSGRAAGRLEGGNSV